MDTDCFHAPSQKSSHLASKEVRFPAQRLGRPRASRCRQGAFGGLDAVITGYFASVDQVDVAARVLDTVRAASPAARLVVDPVMGGIDGKPLFDALAAA